MTMKTADVDTLMNEFARVLGPAAKSKIARAILCGEMPTLVRFLEG